MDKFYRVVVYLKYDDNLSTALVVLEDCLSRYIPEDMYVIREFKETNEHKFNRAKDHEVK